MRKAAAGVLVLPLTLIGCASIEKPPDRAQWDDVPHDTDCTDDKSAVSGQQVGGIILAGLGGWELGAALATGQSPVLGIALAGTGIAMGGNADSKKQEIEKCKEFKSYQAAHQGESRDSPEGSIKEGSVEQRLETIEKMRDEGTISDDEYEDLREKILDDL